MNTVHVYSCVWLNEQMLYEKAQKDFRTPPNLVHESPHHMDDHSACIA